MDNLPLIISIVNAVIAIIVFFKFIGLCSNVEKMTNGTYGLYDFEDRFKILVACGRKDKAYDLLLSQMQQHYMYRNAVGPLASKATQDARAYMQKTYGRYFEVLGCSLDFDKVDELYNLERKYSETK